MCRGLGPSEGVGGAPRGPPFPAVPAAHPSQYGSPSLSAAPSLAGAHRSLAPTAGPRLPPLICSFRTWPAGMGALLRPALAQFRPWRPGPPRLASSEVSSGPSGGGGSGSKLCCLGTLQPGPGPPPSNSRGHHPLLRSQRPSRRASQTARPSKSSSRLHTSPHLSRLHSPPPDSSARKVLSQVLGPQVSAVSLCWLPPPGVSPYSWSAPLAGGWPPTKIG